MVHITDVETFFWGLTLENEKRYSQVVASSFHISMAALEPAQGKHKDEHICVMLQQGESEYLLCTLNHTRLLQQTLDLNFRQNEEITFFLNGKGRVHLTGYIVPEDEPQYQSSDEEADSSEEEEEVSSDDDIPTLQELEDEDDESDSDDESSGGKRKKKQSDKGLKKKLILEEAESDDDDDDSDDEDFDMDLSELLHGDLSEDDSEDESAEDTEGSFIAKPEKMKKGESQQKQEETPAKKKKNKKKKAQEQPETPKSAKEESSDAGTPGSSEKKKKKKKKKKNKNKENGENTPNKDAGKTPDKGKSPQNQGKSPQAGQTPGSAQKPKGKKQVLQGGVVVEDFKEGHGQAATPGRMTGVYYTGKLQSNNKEFDSTKSGPPFKFKLGQKEVIQGWDVGVKGMKVGGKRRITVPAKMAYGNQRQGPIPANSTLVFDVELKSVS